MNKRIGDPWCCGHQPYTSVIVQDPSFLVLVHVISSSVVILHALLSRLCHMDTYQKCLLSAKPRNLCKRGYCTAKSKYAVYPSAYANGYAVQVCKGKKPDYSGSIKEEEMQNDTGLSRWFREQWVNVCEKDSIGNYRPCGRDRANMNQESYPYCRPLHKLQGTTVKTVGELSTEELQQMCQNKRSIAPGVDGKPSRVFVDTLRIRNPKTGRMVKANGRIGRTIRRNQLPLRK